MSEDFSEKFHKLGDKAIASKNGNGDSQFQFSDEVKLLLQQDVKTRRWRFLALVFIAMFVGLLLYIKFEPQPLLANISALIEPSEKKEQENIGGEGLDHKDRDDKSSVDRSTDTAVHAIPAKVKPDFAPQTRNAPYSTYSWKQGSISDLNNLDTFGESTVLDERLVDAQQPDSWEKVPIINADESEALNDAVGTDNLVLCITGAFGVSSHLRTYFDDYAKQSLDYGVSLVLKRYEDETKAIQDYQDGSCPMLAVSGVRARVFNKFTGSIDSFGAVQTYNSLRIIIETVLSKKAEKFLINNDHEIVVILPGAAQFAFVASRNIVTIESFSNRKIGVSTVTPENRYFARVIGMIPIESGSNTIANKFANGVTDVAMLPTSAFTLKKLEGVFQVGGDKHHPSHRSQRFFGRRVWKILSSIRC